MKKVLVTGGAGYKGCVLVPKLLAAGHEVVVYDLMLFGSAGLTPHPRLTVVAGDIRDTAKYAAALQGCDAVIHMAAISNDPSFDLDPSLSRTMNYECFEPLMQATAAAGTVERFINVSSSSVYGVSDAPEVTEEHPLVPLTDYNKYKGLCEPIAFKYQSPKLTVVTFRPATVCGYSPRMRFDLTVNILTNHAYHRGVITVFGLSEIGPVGGVGDEAGVLKRERPPGAVGESRIAGGARLPQQRPRDTRRAMGEAREVRRGILCREWIAP